MLWELSSEKHESKQPIDQV